MKSLPGVKKQRYVDSYGLPGYDADIITSSQDVALYFEAVLSHINNPKMISNWLMGEILRYLNDAKISITEFPVSPELMAQLLSFIDKQEISGSAGKKVFEEMLRTGEDAAKIIDRLNLKQISDSSVLDKIIDDILDSHPEQLQELKSGKDQLIGFFVGQVMKASKGQANPKLVNELIRKKTS